MPILMRSKSNFAYSIRKSNENKGTSNILWSRCLESINVVKNNEKKLPKARIKANSQLRKEIDIFKKQYKRGRYNQLTKISKNKGSNTKTDKPLSNKLKLKDVLKIEDLQTQPINESNLSIKSIKKNNWKNDSKTVKNPKNYSRKPLRRVRWIKESGEFEKE